MSDEWRDNHTRAWSTIKEHAVYNPDNHTITLSFEKYTDLLKKLHTLQQIEFLLKGDEEE